MFKASHRALYSTFFFLSALLLSPLAHSSSITKHKHEAYLFVQSAKKVTIKANPETAHLTRAKTYTIALEGTDPLITYFSDRPIRNAGEMPLVKFMKLWYQNDKNSFAENPPNAVLHVKKTRFFSENEVYDYALELSNARYNEKNKILTFTAKVLPGNVDKIPDYGVFDHVSLFIDSVCLTCWGGK